MSWGIYRSGQGYWVRVMTAVVAGVLVLSTAGWLYKQMSAVRLPIKRWDIAVLSPTGQPTVGETIRLFAGDQRFASGILEGVDAVGTTTLLRVVDLRVTDSSFDPIQATMITSAGGFTGVTAKNGVNAIQVFEQVYLQAGVAALAILVGAAFIYLMTALKPGPVDFLISTDGEMKKVNWSTKRDIYRSTLVVIFASLFIASGLFVVDSVFAAFFKFVGVLQQ